MYFVFVCVLATIRSTVDACDITDHDLGKLVAGLLEVRKKNHCIVLVVFFTAWKGNIRFECWRVIQ